MGFNFMRIKGYIKRSWFTAPCVKIYEYFIGRHRKPLLSDQFWEIRYAEGGNSGLGSYGKLSEFKAEIINSFISKHNLSSVLEFGCGDGNQLKLAKYTEYVGFDVSETAIERCRDMFANDATKRFSLVAEYKGERADLALSLDVIYHLVEDDVFVAYMKNLFSAAKQYVIIYSSDKDHDPEDRVTYVRHRKFTQWILENTSDWELIEHLPNPLRSESFADFYIYRKVQL